MIPFKLDMDRVPLDDWGTPEDIGAQSLGPAPRVAGKILFGTLDSPVSGGLYAATRGRYRVTYPFDEHATLLDGQLALTDEASGRTVVYGPGDSWIIAAGSTIVWDIRSEGVRKSYLAVSSGAKVA
jgi:uncharacterized cupin superfamily protein